MRGAVTEGVLESIHDLPAVIDREGFVRDGRAVEQRPSSRAAPRMRSDPVLAGREGLVKLTGLLEERTQLDYLHGLGLPSVVFKLGARGAVNVPPGMTSR